MTVSLTITELTRVANDIVVILFHVLNMFLHYLRVIKDFVLSSLDHTKQAAIMLMTGHTSKGKQTPSKPGFVPKRPSPVRRTPKTPKTPKAPKTTASTRKISKAVIGVTPKRTSAYSLRNSEVSKTVSFFKLYYLVVYFIF